MSKKNRFRKALREVLGEDLYGPMGDTRRSTKKVSAATVRKRKDVLFTYFPNALWERGYRLEQPRNLRTKHIEAVLAVWEERGLKAKTCETYASPLRYLSTKLGKPHLKEVISDWLAQRQAEEHEARRRVVEKVGVLPTGKSWSALNIDPQKVIDRVIEKDSLVGLQLALMGMFGLRVREAHRLHPGKDWHRKYGFLHVHRGPKGGRPRLVFLDEDDETRARQERLLEHACHVASLIGGSMMPKEMSEIKWRNHYYNVLRVCELTKRGLGGTSHSFRHERAQQVYEAVSGQVAPALKEDRGLTEPELTEEERLLLMQGRNVVAELLGHSRVEITNHYLEVMEAKRMWRHVTTRGHKHIWRRHRESRTDQPTKED